MNKTTTKKRIQNILCTIGLHSWRIQKKFLEELESKEPEKSLLQKQLENNQ